MAAPGPSDDITRLIRLWAAGDPAAGEKLFELILPELRALANRQMRRERPDHTLQPTALVNEIYFRLARARQLDWHDRKHFFAVAARAMRHCLTDYARAHPNVTLQPLDEAMLALPPERSNPEFQLHISRLVDRLTEEEPELATVVEYKYFLGLTDDEASDLMGIGVRTFKRRWQRAREWLYEQSGGASDDGQS